ncbi:hypothetical protein D3C77_616220 [compost metagenome]
MRQARRLLHLAQPLRRTGRRLGAGELIELVGQLGGIQAQQLRIGTDIATREGGTGQLVEQAVLDVTHGILGEVQLQGHFGPRPVPGFPGLAQAFARVDRSRHRGFAVRRVHLYSDR